MTIIVIMVSVNFATIVAAITAIEDYLNKTLTKKGGTWARLGTIFIGIVDINLDTLQTNVVRLHSHQSIEEFLVINRNFMLNYYYEYTQDTNDIFMQTVKQNVKEIAEEYDAEMIIFHHEYGRMTIHGIVHTQDNWP